MFYFLSIFTYCVMIAISLMIYTSFLPIPPSFSNASLYGPSPRVRNKEGGLGSGVWAFGFWGVFMVIFVIYPCIGYGFIFCENFSH